MAARALNGGVSVGELAGDVNELSWLTAAFTEVTVVEGQRRISRIGECVRVGDDRWRVWVLPNPVQSTTHGRGGALVSP